MPRGEPSWASRRGVRPLPRPRVHSHAAIAVQSPHTKSQGRGDTSMELSLGVIAVPILIAILYFLSSIKILAEYDRVVIFRLGHLLNKSKGPGVLFVCSPLDRTVRIALPQ